MSDAHAREADLAMQLMDHHPEQLAAEAKQVLAQHQGARIAGVVLAPDCSEAASMRAEFAKLGRPHPANAAIAMIWSRESALALLRATTPAQLDWLESDEGKLPLVCVTKHGTRLGWAALRDW